MASEHEERTDHLIGLMEMDDKLAKIRTQVNSKLDNQKKLAVVLQTIEENLKDQNQNTTPITYFVSFLTLLDQCCTEDEINDLDLAACALYFLDLVSPYTPSKLLRSKFSEILVRIAPALTNEKADAPLIRSSIGFLESLLLAQDSKSWNNSGNYKISPKRALSALLDLSLDPRPKVRKRAQEAILNILKKSPLGCKSKEHPAASYASEFALNNLITLINENSITNNKSSKSSKDANPSNPKIIHNLQLITSITSSNTWPLKQITPLCDILLEICKSADQFLISAAFNSFEGMFISMTNEIDSKKFIHVLDIIFDLKPSLNDPHLAPSWLAVIAKAVCSFSSNVNSLEILYKLPDIFQSVGHYFLSENSNITESASQCLIAIIIDGIKEKDLLLPPANSNKIYEDVDEIISKISQITLDYLTVRYRQAAKDVCEVISSLFTKLRQRANPDFLGHLELIGNWRSNEQDGFELNEISEKVIASAISSIGPEVVLQVLPLNLTDAKKVGRAWLLPILRENVQMAQLNYYIKNILPNVEFFKEKVSNGNPNSVNTKIFSTIIDQIWSLLPYFCYLPTDLQVAFTDDFAARLSSLLYEEVHLRPVLCNALKNLVIITKQRLSKNEETDQQDLILDQEFPVAKAESDLNYLSTTKANKLLSVLFNVFTQIPMDQRNYVAEAIEAYFTISSSEDMIATFNKVCVLLRKALDDEKKEGTLNKEDHSNSKSNIPKLSVTMMDLIVMMTKYIPNESHNALLTIFNETVHIENSQIQKRSYRIVSKLLDIEDENSKSMITPLIPSIIQVFIETTTITLPSARPQRLDALERLIKLLPRDSLHFITGILSEVIDSTRSANEKTRTTSFALLVQIGNKFKEFNGELIRNTLIDAEIPDSQASIQELFLMCCAAAGPEIPHQRSAAITALSCIFYEFHKDLDISYQKELMQFVEVFLHQNNREVIKPTLGFMKVAILSLPEEEILPELKGLMTEFLVINNKHKNHFKSKIKHLIERMIRKFGFDVIDNTIPEEDKKIINGIRKAKNKAKNASKSTDSTKQSSSTTSKSGLSAFDKALYEESDSDDSDEEVEEQSSSRPNGKQYISESKDTPLDLLDKQALSHISTSRPKKFNKKSVEELTNFKTKNGKLVIKEGGEDDDILSNKNSLNAYVEAVRQGPVRGQKNKLKWKKQGGQDNIDWENDSDNESKTPKKGGNFKSRGGRVGKPQPKFKSKKKF